MVNISLLASRRNKPKKAHTIEVQPFDYLCTKRDESIIEYVASQAQENILVNIDGAFCTRKDLKCLYNDSSFVEDNVLNAYIHLMRAEEHLKYRDGGKVFLENTFVSSILKRDGQLDAEQISPNNDMIHKRVFNYLDHDMVFLPINITELHWYLAVVNARKREIQVLDSLGVGMMNRIDLAETIVGLQRQISIVSRSQKLKNHKWPDIEVAEWPLVEKITIPMQTDRTSCGLFMINNMEYWTGSQLSDNITQDDIKNFRLKLIAILWDSELNTRKAYPDFESNYKKGESPCDVEILDKPTNVCKKMNSHIVSIGNMLIGEDELIDGLRLYIKSIKDDTTLECFRQKISAIMQETRTQALFICSMPVSEQELRDVICNYIISVDEDEALEKQWVLSSKPYPISLSLKKIQGILRIDQAMDVDCFNLAVRKLACEELQSFKGRNKIVSKHYMDLKFCDACQFGKGPQYRNKIDEKQLAELVLRCPWIRYDVSKCSSILIPCAKNGYFLLFVLSFKARTIFILDPFTNQGPLGLYKLRIERMTHVLSLIMKVAYLGWSENFSTWDLKIPNGTQINVERNTTGYYVYPSMCAWSGESLQPKHCMDVYELRKHFLVHLLTYKGNQYASNVPEILRKYLEHYVKSCK